MGESKRKKASGGPANHKRSELQHLFERLNIDYSKPGFYDDPNFLKEEKNNQRMLETYGEWILHRERTPEYDTHVRTTLAKLAPIISARLDRHQWFGGCIAVSATLTRILERLGVWNIVMKGSASIYAGAESRHFAIVDEHEGEGYDTGHQWLIAPPYEIVDLTLYYQRWHATDVIFHSRAPKIVLAEGTDIVRARPQDVIAPALLRQGTASELQSHLPDQRRFSSLFPARRMIVNDLDIRYVPSGMTAPLEPLEGVNTARRGGPSAIELWREDVAPAFEVS
ncbi:hypothetical protein [Methylobacterium variabile]|jgi:hypothetical protein|uniref:hypothetical protein n=1 Tax=Methylobacterium variabile TaxID=298794 RepID=UPI000A8D7178|nr:hypothetical protein [Methylobacterium variabile]